MRLGSKVHVTVLWEPRDLWVGLCWTRDYAPAATRAVSVVRLYLCLVPCVPIVVSVLR